MAVKPIGDKRNISIKLMNQETDFHIFGDKSGLQQVFINLINNAIKFSPKGSTIIVGIWKGNDQVHISIADQGIGIPSDAVPHLFQRFYRAKNVTIAEIPGSGIGLYIVKSIIEKLGGEINVESVPNSGTTFTVSFKDAGHLQGLAPVEFAGSEKSVH